MKIASMSAMALGIMAGVGAATAVGMSSRHTRKRLEKMAKCTAKKISRSLSNMMP